MYLPQFLCLRLLLLCSKWINKVTKCLFGYSLHSGLVKDKVKAKTSYESSVHVCDVLFRGKKLELDNPSNESFLLKHHSYQHPRYLLHEDITLLGCDQQHRVLFVRNPPNYDIYHSKHSPFLFISQFNAATQVMSMSLEHFMLFSKREVPQTPEMKILLLFHTGRCGSTLLAQMLEELPNTIIVSEPDSLTTTHPGILKDLGFPYSSAELTPAMIRVQCKPWQTRKIEHIVIKPRPNSITHLDVVLQECPYAHHLYMYRTPKKCLMSYMALMSSMPSWVLEYFMRELYLAYIFGVLTDKSSYYPRAVEYRNRMRANWDMSYIMINFYALNLRYYKDTKRDLDDPSRIFELNYDTLMTDPTKTVNDILAYIGSAAGPVRKHFKSLDRDSQENSGLSQKNLKRYNKPLSYRELNIVDEVFSAYDLPSMAEFESGQVKTL